MLVTGRGMRALMQVKDNPLFLIEFPKLQNGLAKAKNYTTSEDTPRNQEQITGYFWQPQEF